MPLKIGWDWVVNMTRETKLGLVVSCSFLCLLGVVLGLKMSEEPADEQVVALGDNTPPGVLSDEEEDWYDDSESDPPKQEMAATSSTDPQFTPASFPTVPTVPLSREEDKPRSSPQPPSTAVAAGPSPGQETPETTSPNAPTPPPLPPTAEEEKPKPATPPALPTHPVTADTGTGNKPAAETKPETETKPASAGGPGLPTLPAAPNEKKGEKAPQEEEKVNEAVVRGPMPPVPADGTSQTVPTKPEQRGSEETLMPRVPAASSGPPPLPPLAGAGAALAPTPTPTKPIPPLPDLKDTTVAAPKPPPPDLPSLPPVTSPAPVKPSAAAPAPLPTAPTDGIRDQEPLKPTVPDKPSVPPVEPVAVAPVASPPIPVAPADKPSTPPADTVREVTTPTQLAANTAARGTPAVAAPARTTSNPGRDTERPTVVGTTPPTAMVPPLAVSGPPGGGTPPAQLLTPRVITFTEEVHVWRAGDTFEKVSAAKYGSDRYASALLLFNRSHPLAPDELARGGAGRAGQRVYLPPAEVLESRYPAAVKPASRPASAGESRRSDAAPAARTYTVGARGETMREIAKRELGGADRWFEIAQANPGWKPEYPVPAGTVLTLPERK